MSKSSPKMSKISQKVYKIIQKDLESTSKSCLRHKSNVIKIILKTFGAKNVGSKKLFCSIEILRRKKFRSADIWGPEKSQFQKA